MAPAFSDIFPPSPPFTERNLPSQSSRVFIITGATSGVGLALASILYAAGGTVYICGRSASSTSAAIATVKKDSKTQGQGNGAGKAKAKGRLEAMVLDLADLSTVKPAVRLFLEKESRLDVLVHNAGVMVPPKGSTSVQGHDLEMSTHCLAPFLLTTLLTPLLQKTAALSPSTPYAVRIVWVATLLGVSGIPGAMELNGEGIPVVQKGAMENYVQSKIGSVWLADSFAKKINTGGQDGETGILSLSVHPGFLKTSLQKNLPAPLRGFMGIVFKGPVWGAQTELFAGFSPDLTAKDNGGYIVAWGRRAVVPKDVEDGMRVNGKADVFWKYCEASTKEFL